MNRSDPWFLLATEITAPLPKIPGERFRDTHPQLFRRSQAPALSASGDCLSEPQPSFEKGDTK